MQYETSTLEDGIQLVKLSGRLDVKGANEISDKFGFDVGADKSSSIIEMSEVEFLASIGMRMLISAARAKTNRGYKMVLLNPTPLVKDALITAGFEALIPMFGDLAEARAFLQAEQ